MSQLKNRPALRFIVPYSFEKYIERLYSLNGKEHVYSVSVAYYFRVSVHILEEEPASSATFVIETPQRIESQDQFPLSLSVVGTVEPIDETIGQSYIEVYRSPNWFLRFIVILIYTPIMLLMIGFYLGIRADGEPPELASSLVLCNMLLLPISIWFFFGIQLENRRRFREIAQRLGYPAPPNWISRRFVQPIHRFIEGSRTLALNLPYSMSDGLHHLHQLRDISKNSPAIDRLVISCPNKIDADTQLIEFQIRRKAEGFSGDKLARIDGIIEHSHNFSGRCHLSATYLRSQKSIDRRRFVMSILGAWTLILVCLAIIGITGIFGTIFPMVVGSIGTILITIFAGQRLASDQHELIDIFLNILLSEKPKRVHLPLTDLASIDVPQSRRVLIINGSFENPDPDSSDGPTP